MFVGFWLKYFFVCGVLTVNSRYFFYIMFVLDHLFNDLKVVHVIYVCAKNTSQLTWKPEKFGQRRHLKSGLTDFYCGPYMQYTTIFVHARKYIAILYNIFSVHKNISQYTTIFCPCTTIFLSAQQYFLSAHQCIFSVNINVFSQCTTKFSQCTTMYFLSAPIFFSMHRYFFRCTDIFFEVRMYLSTFSRVLLRENNAIEKWSKAM
jgi:hypothetical protein